MLPGKSVLNIFYSDSLSAFIFVEPPCGKVRRICYYFAKVYVCVCMHLSVQILGIVLEWKIPILWPNKYCNTFKFQELKIRITNLFQNVQYWL